MACDGASTCNADADAEGVAFADAVSKERPCLQLLLPPFVLDPTACDGTRNAAVGIGGGAFVILPPPSTAVAARRMRLVAVHRTRYADKWW